MPLIKQYEDQSNAILVWNITEELSFFETEVDENIKSITRLKEKACVQYVLRRYCNVQQLLYDNQGKPYLANQKRFISISHSKGVVVVALSNESIGVDVEQISKKAHTIRKKFLHVSEFDLLKSEKDPLFFCTLLWSAKEACFKKHSDKEHLIFSEQIHITDLDLVNKKIAVTICFEDGTILKELLAYRTYYDYVLVNTL